MPSSFEDLGERRPNEFPPSGWWRAMGDSDDPSDLNESVQSTIIQLQQETN